MEEPQALQYLATSGFCAPHAEQSMVDSLPTSRRWPWRHSVGRTFPSLFSSSWLLRILLLPLLEEWTFAECLHQRSAHGDLDALAVLPPPEEPDQIRMVVVLEDQVDSAEAASGPPGIGRLSRTARTTSGILAPGWGFSARHGVARIRALP